MPVAPIDSFSEQSSTAFSGLPEFDVVEFYKVDADAQPDIAQEVGIRAMPTFIVFKDGQKVGELTGANPEALRNLFSASTTFPIPPLHPLFFGASEKFSDDCQVAADMQRLLAIHKVHRWRSSALPVVRGTLQRTTELPLQKVLVALPGESGAVGRGCGEIDLEEMDARIETLGAYDGA
ncbi:thioredoxin [Aspergillus udagawae]|nr:thioredoxin [Aspergillus udagawae]